MDYQLQKNIKTIAHWSKFLGYLMMIAGVIQAIAGLVPMVLPALLGIISFVLGKYMVNAGKKAEEFLNSYSEKSMAEMIEYLAKYFKLQGIYSLVALGFVVLVFVGFTIALMAGIVAMPYQ